MPEMPEVETVRRTLTPLIKGKTIEKVILWYPKIVATDHDKFVNELPGKKIICIDRYAKYLLIRLSDNLTIVSHLRMEGKYHLTASRLMRLRINTITLNLFLLMEQRCGIMMCANLGGCS